MLTNIVDCDPDGVRIGQRGQRPLPPDAAGRLLPVFAPAHDHDKD